MTNQIEPGSGSAYLTVVFVLITVPDMEVISESFIRRHYLQTAGLRRQSEGFCKSSTLVQVI